MGYALMGMFLPPYITYNAPISASLNYNFLLKFEVSKPYINHSRYLTDVTSLGSNNNSVTLNGWDNNITGNSGTNTVIFSGKESEYSMKVLVDKNIVIVTDAVEGRDGTNTLSNIEKLQFTDKTIGL